MITDLNEPRMGKLTLNHSIGNNCPEFRDGLLDSSFFETDFRKWLFGTLSLDSRFDNYPDSLILQKYQLLSNQNFGAIWRICRL